MVTRLRLAGSGCKRCMKEGHKTFHFQIFDLFCSVSPPGLKKDYHGLVLSTRFSEGQIAYCCFGCLICSNFLTFPHVMAKSVSIFSFLVDIFLRFISYYFLLCTFVIFIFTCTCKSNHFTAHFTVQKSSVASPCKSQVKLLLEEVCLNKFYNEFK